MYDIASGLKGLAITVVIIIVAIGVMLWELTKAVIEVLI